MFVVIAYHRRDTPRVFGPFATWAEAETFEKTIARNTSIVKVETPAKS